MQGVVGGLITACHTHPFLFNLSRSLSEDKVAHSKSPQNLTQDRLKELLHYDPETGIFTRRVNRRGGAKAGVAVGYPDKTGYMCFKLLGKHRKIHRLAFLYMEGVFPPDQVDHINGDRADNRWANLRHSNAQENAHNYGGPTSKNRAGYLGVSVTTCVRPYRACIGVLGKVKHLGNFTTPEAAHAAYLKAKDELHPTHRRLRSAA